MTAAPFTCRPAGFTFDSTPRHPKAATVPLHQDTW
jgi:hypothetical protein